MQATNQGSLTPTAEIFNHARFGTIRTIEVDGRILFCGRDVATALGYTNTKDALARHCKGVVNHYPLQTPGGYQQLRFITEGDLYRLIASSKLPAAQEFESWIFDEVLPSVRRTGGYLTPNTVEAMLSDPDVMIQMLTAYKEEQSARAQLEHQAALNAPKVDAYDAFMDADGKYSMGTVAKMLGLGQNKLFRELRNAGVLIPKGPMYNTPYQQYMHHFEVRATTIRHSDGRESVRYTTYVQPSGIDFIRRKLGLTTQGEIA